ncbi:MAG: hypothetical protein IT336_11835 [Thermomicrobiales bacterium]|nr:hypothetical protein [Thermomicrobiales bacterium]
MNDIGDGAPSATCQCARGYEFIDGACRELVCQTGSNCSGRVSCGDVDSSDLCCQYPQTAYCTCSSPVTGQPAVGCCTWGVDCPSDLGWDSWAEAGVGGPCVVDGIAGCCCDGPECVWGGDVSLTCDEFAA